MMRTMFAITLVAVLTTSHAEKPGPPMPTADPSGNDLANCVWANGSPMSEGHCKQARREEQLRLEHKTWLENQKKAKDADQKEQTAEEARRKKACGKDFHSLRIGMTLDRFEQCSWGLVYMTDTVTSSGVVETYRSPFYIIHARDGLIVSFTRRTN